MDERVARAGQRYELAVFGGDSGELPAADQELDAVEADLALARGRIRHAQYLAGGTEDPAELALFGRAAALYQKLGDVRGEGEALFWVAIVHQVVRDDNDTATPILERAFELATVADDKLTLSYVLRHQGFAERAAGRLATARERLEESVRLRREIGFLAGVAANLVALTYLAAEQNRLADALALIDEARDLAEAADARGTLRWVIEARDALADMPNGAPPSEAPPENGTTVS